MSDGIGESFTLLSPTREGGGCEAWRRITGEWEFGRRWPIKVLPGMSDISQARSALASWWLQYHRTPWSLWLDDDIVTDFAAVEAFAHVGLDNWKRLDLLAVSYVPKRAGGRGMAVLFRDDQVTLGVGGGLIPVESAGFGMVAIKREVFERVALNLHRCRYPEIDRDCIGWPFFLGMVTECPGDPDGAGRQKGEDFAFCLRARAAGCRLFCDTRVRVWHRGPYDYGWEDAGNTVPRADSIRVARMFELGGEDTDRAKEDE